MNDDQFTKLFKYMQEEFGKIHTELDAKASATQLEHIVELLDGDAGMRKTDEEERAALSHQVDRLDKRVNRLERKLA